MRVEIAVTAIIALTVLEGLALWTGHNGVLFAVVIAAISGIAGYNLRKGREEDDGRG